MRPDELPVETTRLVTPRTVKAYAEALGWKRVEGVNGTIAVYQNPKAPLRQMIVPLDEKLDDYAERMGEAILKVAEFEKRPAVEILSHLLLPPADLIRFREVSSAAEAGDLPLEHAVRLIDGTRRMLLSVAHSVVAPQPYHPRMSRGAASDFLARCRLGQTERGSFVLTVACPLDLQAGLFGPNHESFARRVTILFMKSLQDLSQASETESADGLADLSRHPGISANLCESLLLLRPAGDRAYLDVSTAWSRALLPSAHDTLRSVHLSQEAFEIAEALGPRLRSLPKPRVDRFFGYVEELRGQPTPQDPQDARPRGEVRFALFDQDEEIHARADLSAEDYITAAKAHLATDLVGFKGILRRLPRLNHIDHVTDFRRIRLDDDGVPVEETSAP